MYHCLVSLSSTERNLLIGTYLLDIVVQVYSIIVDRSFRLIFGNQIRNITASSLLQEVCKDVHELNHLCSTFTGEEFSEKMANISDEARLDITARGFWITGHQMAFCDARVFSTLTLKVMFKKSHKTIRTKRKRKEKSIQRPYHKNRTWWYECHTVQSKYRAKPILCSALWWCHRP